MPSLQDYAEAICQNAPALGLVFASADFTLTTTTVTIPNLDGVYPDDYFNRTSWLWRLGADGEARLKGVSDYVGATGVFTIRGADYTDITVGTEGLVVAFHHPSLYIDAINRVLHKLSMLDFEIIPGYKRAVIPLGSLPWVLGANHIQHVYLVDSPILNRNWDFRKWNDIDSSGNLTPDDWAINGTNAVMSRDATNIERGLTPYSASVQRVTNNAYIGQTVDWRNGVNAESLRGESVILYGRVRATVPSRARLVMVQTLEDNTTITTNSTAFHSGNSQFEELSTVAVTLSNTLMSISIRGSVEGGDTTAQFSRIGLIKGSSIPDDLRRDDYVVSRREIRKAGDTPGRGWRYSQSPQALVLPSAPSWGEQIEIAAWRPYFDAATRLSGDGDDCDAPEEVVAFGAIAHIYRSLAGAASGDKRAEYLQEAADYDRKYQQMARAHPLEPDHSRIVIAPGGHRLTMYAPYGSR